MKKAITVIIVAIVCLLALTACMYDHELTIGIGDGSVPDDGVSVKLKYNNEWTGSKEEPLFKINYGHESKAALADEYTVAFSNKDPLLSSSYTMNAIFSFDKASLQGRSVSGTKFSGEEADIIVEDLSAVLPSGEGVCSVFIVFYSTDTDFNDITTFASYEIKYEWTGENTVTVVG